MVTRLCVLLCLLSLTKDGNSYSSGAPSGVCKQMVPLHDIPPQTSGNPYDIKLLPDQSAEGRVKMELWSMTDNIAGIFLQARSSLSLNSSTALGSFVELPSFLKTVQCGLSPTSAVTHGSRMSTKKIQVEWEAPYSFDGEVTFMATFVKDFQTFWNPITSSPVRVTRGAAPTDSESASLQLLYKGCGSSKYCVGNTPDCLRTKTCRFVLTAHESGGKLEISMMGQGTNYVAVGISEDPKMGNDLVFGCVRNEQDDARPIHAYKSWNDQKSNVKLDEQTGLSLLSSKAEGKNIYCTMSIDMKHTVRGNVFDIERNPYYFLYAMGDKIKSVADIGYHDLLRGAAPDKRLLFNTEAPEPSDDFYKDCNTLKSCFGSPAGCEQKRDCTAVVSIFPRGDKFEFELQVKNAAWVGLGLSEDNKMGGDSVMECVVEDSEPEKVKAYASWNKPSAKANTRENVDQETIQLLNSSYSNGKIYCRLSRKSVSYVQGTKFDLLNNEFYILLAYGSSLNGQRPGVGYHDLGFVATDQKARLSDIGAYSAATNLFVKLHGSFMIAAWIGSASIGLVLARHFKQTWVVRKLCGKDMWFVGHVFCMFSTWALTITAFVLIFVEIQDWVSSSSQLHAILGCITTFFCFIQPIGALFRPAPNAPNRKIFNWLHWGAGNCAHIAAIVTIYFSISLSKAQLPEWTTFVLVAFVVIYILGQMTFEIGGCLKDMNKSNRINSFPMKDMDMRSSIYQWERKQDAPLSRFRRVVLGIYICLIILVTAFLIILVVLSPFETYLSQLRKQLNI